MRKTLLTCLALLALAGCDKPPASRAQTDNSAIQVDTLFTKDGCTVYRFVDMGHHRYFVRCDGGQTRTEWSEECGKGCAHYAGVSGDSSAWSSRPAKQSPR